MSDNANFNLTDLAEGQLAGPEWERWQAANPEAAVEVLAAHRVRELMSVLAASEIIVPAGFEDRVLAAVRADTTLLDLLDLGLAGLLRVLLELLSVFFDPQPVVVPA